MSPLRRRKLSSPIQNQKANEPTRVNIGVTIRSDIWRELRALAIKQDRKTGELLDEAIEKYLNKNR